MEGRDALIPVLRRYWNFLQREHILAILIVTASLVGTSITYLMAMPQWVTSMAALATFIIGSLFVFRREEKQRSSKLLSELEDFSNTFYSLTMAGSDENSNTRIMFILDRVQIPDGNEKHTFQMRLDRIRICHGLNEKRFKCYVGTMEYFLKHSKSIDSGQTIRLVNEYKEIVTDYMDECINPSIDLINDVPILPKDLEEKLDAFKTKYNHCMNQFNNYIKRFNKELSQQLNGVGNISKKFATRFM